MGDQVYASLARSLATLATVVPPNDDGNAPPRPYLDALVLHVPYRDPAHTQQAWLAMSRAVRAGHVRQLGISNASRADLAHLVAWCRRGGATTTTTQAGAGAGDGAAVEEPLVVVPPTIVQNLFYPGPEGDFDLAVRQYCSSSGSIMMYQAFGLLRNKALVEDEASVGAVARLLGVSRPVALYALVTEALLVPGQQGDIRVLDGTTRADRMEEDVAGVERAVAALRRAKRTSTSTVTTTPSCAGNDDDDDEALNRAMVSFRMGFGQDEME